MIPFKEDSTLYGHAATIKVLETKNHESYSTDLCHVCYSLLLRKFDIKPGVKSGKAQDTNQ
jgi:hypothetical protein